MNRDCWENCALGACPEYPCDEIGEDPAPFWVYVAGRLSGDPGEYLANVALLASVSRELAIAGFCPVNPAGDLIEGLCSINALPVVAYQRRSLDLVRLVAAVAPCAAMLVTSDTHRDGRPSDGVAAEIELAAEIGLPVVRCTADLYELRRTAR